jgi:murein DD-endopeptidase MepM/ murein hydrolase activator NlpD
LPSPVLAVRRAIAGAARIGLPGLDRHERLLPAGVCALLLAAVLASALPPAGAATADRPWAEYGTGADGVEPPATQAPPTLAPELAIDNVLREPLGGWPRVGFTSYVTQKGDSLQSVAAHFDIDIVTLYFANQKSVSDPGAPLKVGLRLLVPPLDGAIAVVADGQTLMDVANAYGVSGESIIDANALKGPSLTVGQTLVVPGVYPGNLPGAPGANGGTKYVGGSFWWPVYGPWRITQGYWSGHHAIDIAADYGTPVVAAAGGKVVYAGWRSYEQGGNVVWIEHNGGLYTTYNHLSKWSVSWGQTVRAGQKVGEIGMSGITSGPHLHFEVWVGRPWRDGTSSNAVNPCHYLIQC